MEERERAFVCNDICSISSRSPSRVRRQRSARQLSPPKRGNWTERPGGRGGGPLPLLSSPSSPRPFLSPLLFCFPPPCPCSLLLCSLPSCELPIQRLANGNADPSSLPPSSFLFSPRLFNVLMSLSFFLLIYFFYPDMVSSTSVVVTRPASSARRLSSVTESLFWLLSLSLSCDTYSALYIYIYVYEYIYIYIMSVGV